MRSATLSITHTAQSKSGRSAYRGTIPLAAHRLEPSTWMLPYLPTTLLQAGHPPTRSRPGAVIRRWQRNCPYKPLRGRTQADTQNDRYHKVPAIRYHIWTSYLWLYYTSEHMDMQQRGLDSFRQYMLFDVSSKEHLIKKRLTECIRQPLSYIVSS